MKFKIILFLSFLTLSLYSQNIDDIFFNENILSIEKHDIDIFLKKILKNISKESAPYNLKENEAEELKKILFNARKKKLKKEQVYALFSLGKLIIEDGKNPEGIKWIKKSINYFDKAFTKEDLDEKLISVYLNIFKYSIDFFKKNNDEELHKWLLYVRDTKSNYATWNLIRKSVLIYLLDSRLELLKKETSSVKIAFMARETIEDFKKILNYYPELEDTFKLEIKQILEQQIKITSDKFYETNEIKQGISAFNLLKIYQSTFLLSESNKILYEKIGNDIEKKQKKEQGLKVYLYTLIFSIIIAFIFIFFYIITLKKDEINSNKFFYAFSKITKAKNDRVNFETSLMQNDPIGMSIKKLDLSFFSILMIFCILDIFIVVIWSIYNNSFSHYIKQTGYSLDLIINFFNNFKCEKIITTFLDDKAGRINYLVIAPLGSALIYHFYRVIEKYYNSIINKMIYKENNIIEKAIKFRKMFISPIWVFFSALLAILLCHIVSLKKMGMWNSISEGGLGFYCRYIHSFITYYIFALFCFKVLLFLYFQFKIRDAKIWIQPVHKDGCGGLSAFGNVGLAANFIVCLLGVFIALNAGRAAGMEYDSPLTWTYLILYVLVAPFIFFYPLLNIHKKLKKIKDEEIKFFEEQVKVYYFSYKEQTSPSMANIEKFNHIKQFYETIKTLPEWPFNVKVFIQFLTTYLIPIIIMASKLLLSEELELLGIFNF